jgi:hypothetical protein
VRESGRIYIQESIRRKDYEGRIVDLTHAFVEDEYKPFPVGLHEDMLDAIARICDPEMTIIWPRPTPDPGRLHRRPRRKCTISYMAA